MTERFQIATPASGGLAMTERFEIATASLTGSLAMTERFEIARIPFGKPRNDREDEIATASLREASQ
jgi:hypothetical protein